MPEISRFFGIVIYMNWREHPVRALSLVREWLALHRDELAQDWALAMAKKPLNPIDPLE